MRVKKSFGLVLGVWWGLALGFGATEAQAQNVTVAGNNRTVDLDGQSRDFTIAGNQDNVRIKGECKSVQVMGNQNTVHLERVDEISVTGAQNRVAKVEGQEMPAPGQRTQPGNGGGSADGQIVLAGDDSNLTRNVNAQQVRVLGDRNKIILAGSVDELLVTGKNNSVAVEKVRKVRFLGDNNRVSYKSTPDGQKPEVASLGENNSIRQTDQ